jgi:DNA-directed RNA polymerase II subunit RPB2
MHAHIIQTKSVFSSKGRMEAHARHILKLYFEAFPRAFVRHHLESYDDFLTRRLPGLLQATSIEHEHLGRRIVVFIGGKDGSRIRYISPQNEAGKPLFPNEALLKKMTYAVTVQVDVDIEYHLPPPPGSDKPKILRRTIENLDLCTLPMPVYSRYCNLNMFPSIATEGIRECAYEPGGYFIVDGGEKVLITQEGMGANLLFVGKAAADSVYESFAEVRSGSDDGTLQPLPHKVWVCRTHEQKLSKALIDEEKEKQKQKDVNGLEEEKPEPEPRPQGMMFEHWEFSKPVPLTVLFRALGVEADRDILEYILLDASELERRTLAPRLVDMLLARRVTPDVQIWTTHEAITYLQEFTHMKSKPAVLDLLTRGLFPHLGPGLARKAFYLGMMARKALRVASDLEPSSDRDHFKYKRMLVTGDLCFNLFASTFTRDVLPNFVTSIDKKLTLDTEAFSGDKILGLLDDVSLPHYMRTRWNALGLAFLTSFKGSWMGGVGVSQVMPRISYLWALAVLRRSALDVGDSGGKVAGPRKLHGSSLGFTCPIDSPDGGELGLKKHLSLLALVSTATSASQASSAIVNISGFIPLETLSPKDVKRGDLRVFVNGAWIGIHNNPPTLHRTLLRLRREGELPKTTSIAWRVLANELIIWTDAGRLCRPLYRLQKDSETLITQKELMALRTWETLLQRYVDYVDAEETDTLLISQIPAVEGGPAETLDDLQHARPNLFQEWTHSEIHHSFLLSLSSNMVPYLQHNASVRNILTVQQARQAVGIYVTNWMHRLDSPGVVLHYPQRGLLRTEMTQYVGDGRMASGQNVILAIMSYGGYNQEDSLLLNSTFLDRGGFGTSYYSEETESEVIVDDQLGTKSQITNPTQGRFAALVKPQDGLDYSFLDESGVAKVGTHIEPGIVMVGCVAPRPDGTWRDVSRAAKKGTHGIVDRVFRYTSASGLQTVRIKLREIMTPSIGDKFVIPSCAQKGTVGRIVPPEDMPFTSRGIRPDFIMNPHAIPSRMTGAAVMEMVTCKAAAMEGMFVDASPFVPREDPAAVFGNILEHYGFDRLGEEYLYNGMTGERILTTVFIGVVMENRLKHMVDLKINTRTEGPMKSMTKQPAAGKANEGGLRIGEMERDALISHGAASFLRESMMERSDGCETLLNPDTGRMDVMRDARKPERIKLPYCMKLFAQELEACHIGTHILTNTKLSKLQ